MDQRETTGKKSLIGSFVMTISLNIDLCVKRGYCVCCTRLYHHINGKIVSIDYTVRFCELKQATFLLRTL